MAMVCAHLLALLLVAQSQPKPSEQPPFVAQMTEMLGRAGSGHSPTDDEMMAVESEPGLTSGEVANTLMPLLKRALTDPDAAVRQYGLAMLVGIQTLPDAKAASPDRAAGKPGKGDALQGVSARYQADVGKALTPLIPILGARLIDEHPENRALAATDLGGFAPNPPASAYSPLLNFLQRDDAVSPVGISVVGDLLAFGPVSPETADAILRFIRRPDQTPETRAGLVEVISSRLNRSRAIDQELVSFLDSDDASVRARLVLALPLLDLSPETYERLKSRVGEIAAVGSQEPADVVAAARAIFVCWTQVKMEKGCPSN